MNGPLFARFELFGMTCCTFRCATTDAAVSLADALLPPDGDETLRPAGEADRGIRGTHACFFLQMEKTRILIDSGLQTSVLTMSMREAGITPESIDLILLTHGDHDHIGGLADNHGNFAFPNARIVMHEALWEAWTSDGQLGDPGAFYADEQRDLVRSLVPQIETHVQLVSGSGTIIPGIRHVAAPGHRASHLAFSAETETGRVLFMGDAFVFPEVFEDLSRGVSFDSDPQIAIQTRHQLLEVASREDTVSCIPHFPFPGLVNIAVESGTFCWSPWSGSNRSA